MVHSALYCNRVGYTIFAGLKWYWNKLIQHPRLRIVSCFVRQAVSFTYLLTYLLTYLVQLENLQCKYDDNIIIFKRRSTLNKRIYVKSLIIIIIIIVFLRLEVSYKLYLIIWGGSLRSSEGILTIENVKTIYYNGLEAFSWWQRQEVRTCNGCVTFVLSLSLSLFLRFLIRS